MASVGASVVLVAAAALSLLAVSAVFAFSDWSGPFAKSVTKPALIFAGSTLTQPEAAGLGPAAEPLVAPAPARRPVKRAEPRRPAAKQRKNTPGRSVAPPSQPEPPVQVAPPPPPPVTTRPAPRAGDAVRAGGETISGVVEATSGVVGRVADPLAPPISAATQKLLNDVAELLRRSAGAAGGAVDALPGLR